MARIASFHLARERHAVLAMAHLGTDRRRLAATPGLAFWRLLGTGRGDDTGPGADLHRTALFAVWEEEAALDAFVARSAIARRWSGAEECWHVRLRGISGHGSWRGTAVLDGLTTGSAAGAIAVVTRADVRLRAWPAFRRAARRVNAEVRAADGLLGAVGIGEAPVGRLGTFSLWRSAADIDAFGAADGPPGHVDAVRRTRSERWYGEELFARFEPYASSGTWGGGDPLRP